MNPVNKLRSDATRRLLVRGLALAPFASLAPAARAAAFPSKMVRLVVPFAPGTPGELWTRLVAPKLQALWGQTVIIENRPGASGLIGAELVARGDADGHTILMGSQSTAMGALTSASIRFDPQDKLVPVRKAVNYKVALVTNTATYSKAKTIQEFIALSKTTPDGLFLGSTGAGSITGVAGRVVSEGLGIAHAPVDYPGLAQYLIGLQRNDVQYVLYPTNAIKPFIDKGEVHPLVVLSDDRFPDMPTVPTVREAGYKGFMPQLWNGLFVAKGTPQAIIDQIDRDVQSVTASTEMQKTIEEMVGGLTPKSSPKIFADELREETRNWKSFFTSINFKPS